MNAQVTCTIDGISPLLMHAYPLVPIEALEKKTIEEQAELACYRDPDGMLYVPGVNIQRALIAGATFSKGKGRASLQKPVAACTIVSPERVILAPQAYAIDTRPVVIPSTRGRVLRHRPRFDQWSLTFNIDFDPDLVTIVQLRRVLDDAGQRVGLLDFRPECKGPFGRFQVTSWVTA